MKRRQSPARPLTICLFAISAVLATGCVAPTSAPSSAPQQPPAVAVESSPSQFVLPTVTPTSPYRNQGPAPELTNEVWLNSEPLRLADLRGKVVMIDFWTYG
jgi:hypothetical protein